MKYQPIIDLWQHGTQEAIAAGRLPIQCGQWVYCGRKDHPSRYVSHTERGTFNVVHWQGSAHRTQASFKLRCKMAKRERIS